MNDSIAVLGRQPELGFAELESLYGTSNVIRVNERIAQIHTSANSVNFQRLGGTIRLCKILNLLNTTADWEDIVALLVNDIPANTEQMSPGKIHLGLSVYGIKLSPKQILAGGLRIKRAIYELNGRSVHLVPNNQTELNSAQVIHNKLISNNGWELIIIRGSNNTIIAQTINIQDIENYGLRDFGRPKRNPRVGMLPPKLAQIIINLATGPDKRDMTNPKQTPKIIFDPFCGTGVVLQEAALMGYAIYGNDIEPQMVESTKQNLQWLADRYKLDLSATKLVVGDATNYRWDLPIDFVVSETYLGRPFTSLPSSETLTQTVSDCNVIIKKFLTNIHSQLNTGTRLCLAVPAWQINSNKFIHLPLIDHLRSMGYNRLSFGQTHNNNLIYYRPDQIVARELLVLNKG